MKQKINLTPQAGDSIHVSEVDVAKGVYCNDSEDNIGFVNTTIDNQFEVVWVTSGKTMNFQSLDGLVTYATNNWGGTFYTLSNRRITTEKQLCIDDLKNTDHVGFVDVHGGKFEVVECVGGMINAVCKNHPVMMPENQIARSSNQFSIADLMAKVTAKEVWLFDTATGDDGLYAWLAE